MDLIKNYLNQMYQGTGVAKPQLFELSKKLYFYFYLLQSVEILLSDTVVSDGFTHRPRPRAGVGK